MFFDTNIFNVQYSLYTSYKSFALRHSKTARLLALPVALIDTTTEAFRPLLYTIEKVAKGVFSSTAPIVLLPFTILNQTRRLLLNPLADPLNRDVKNKIALHLNLDGIAT